MPSDVQNDFVRIWEHHYITMPRPKPEATIGKKTCVAVTEPQGQMKTLKRTSSRRCLTRVREPFVASQPDPLCAHCKDEFDRTYIYLAFDKKYCSAQCRLENARQEQKNFNEQFENEHGTTSYYVDYNQMRKYLSDV
jgi:hypothetical protein